jgi:hypothetical protein
VYISPDDAKTDVILAAAVTVLGLTLRGFLGSLPLYPRSGLAAAVLDLIWIVALTLAVPILLARYRQDGADAFGFSGTGRAIGSGFLLAVPVLLAGVGLQALVFGMSPSPIFGRLAGPLAAASPAGLGLSLGRVALLSLGTLVLVGFLAVRSREGFPRSPDTSLTQLVRTIGLGAVGVAAVGGLLRGLTGGSVLVAIANAATLAAILLLTDRLVPTGLSVPRTTVVAPVVVVVVGNVFATGGLFRGDLLTGLTVGALATGVTVAIASLAQTRHGALAAAPLVVAVHFWPTCLSPLVLVRALEPLGAIC